ncbi:MAG: DUF2851 family protein [Bacteroidetes bacterium]|nr:DUF2851 family protein [Bacteroidota bacterium]
MQERLLQYIWQHQYFNSQSLQTTCGKQVTIIHQGTFNTNQGPDFLHARIQIDQVFWAGSIEMHVRSSDWLKHGHATDTHYHNVVLHVVWEHDGDVSHHPVLELKGRVALSMLQRFEILMQQADPIPCCSRMKGIDDFIWSSWKTRLVAERLETKTAFIHERLKACGYHWEEVCWRMFARYFGVPVNGDAMEDIAVHIPIKILRKHKRNIDQLEALLMGVGTLLEGQFSDDYPLRLQKEYYFLRHKYRLKPVAIPLQFLRMRPIGFPTVRLSMLAMLIHRSSRLFSSILSAQRLADVEAFLDVAVSDYWNTHYVFDQPSPFRPKKLGKHMISHLIINVIVPLLYAYGTHSGEEVLKEKALAWMEQTAREKNRITALWEALGVKHNHAFDSQALLHLQNHYCAQRRCLQCVIGNAILKPA